MEPRAEQGQRHCQGSGAPFTPPPNARDRHSRFPFPSSRDTGEGSQQAAAQRSRPAPSMAAVCQAGGNQSGFTPQHLNGFRLQILLIASHQPLAAPQRPGLLSLRTTGSHLFQGRREDQQLFTAEVRARHGVRAQGRSLSPRAGRGDG